VVNAYPQQVQANFGSDVADIRWGKRVRTPDVMDAIQIDDVIAMLDRLLGSSCSGSQASD